MKCVYYAGSKNVPRSVTKPSRPVIATWRPPFKLDLRRDPYDDRDLLFQLVPVTGKPVVDHAKGMSPVKNQGRLGSCVGFAVAAMKEWQEQKEHLQEVSEGKRDHRDGKPYDFSEQWVYYMAKKIDVWPGMEGTSIRYALKVLYKIGVPTEKGWTYDDKKMGNPEDWTSMIARWALIKAYHRLNGLAELKQALRDGPVPIGVGCFREFFSAGKNGIVKDPQNPAQCYGGHAVCAVGYNDHRKLIKFKNSWGIGWGQKGYGYLSYNYINKYLWDAWSCQDMSVTKEMMKGKGQLLQCLEL